jgi:phosphonate transport system permease protein
MIRTLEWPSVAFIVVLMLLVVTAIDALSTRLRAAIAGNATA